MQNQFVKNVSMAAIMMAVSACGGNDDAGVVALPKAPQILPSVSSDFLTFALTAANTTKTTSVTLLNGGQDPLVISNFALQGRDAGKFSTDAEGATLKSGEALSVSVAFHPTARGVALAQLLIESNAANFPQFTLELVGPGANPALLSPGVFVPDIAAFEDPAVVSQPAGTAAPLAIARYFNLGSGMLTVTGYALANNGSNAYGFPANLTQPAGCNIVACNDPVLPQSCLPIRLNSGSWVAVPINFSGSAGQNATLEIKSNDPDSCPFAIQLHRN